MCEFNGINYTPIWHSWNPVSGWNGHQVQLLLLTAPKKLKYVPKSVVQATLSVENLFSSPEFPLMEFDRMWIPLGAGISGLLHILHPLKSIFDWQLRKWTQLFWKGSLHILSLGDIFH